MGPSLFFFGLRFRYRRLEPGLGYPGKFLGTGGDVSGDF